jgi:hypothetical protein
LVGGSARRKTSTYIRQHNMTKTNIHAASGIRTHGLSDQEIKAYVTDFVATGTSRRKLVFIYYVFIYLFHLSTTAVVVMLLSTSSQTNVFIISLCSFFCECQRVEILSSIVCVGRLPTEKRIRQIVE